jgi:hypothetical protein
MMVLVLDQNRVGPSWDGRRGIGGFAAAAGFGLTAGGAAAAGFFAAAGLAAAGAGLAAWGGDAAGVRDLGAGAARIPRNTNSPSSPAIFWPAWTQ